MNKVLKLFQFVLQPMLPIIPNTVFFSSFYGQYNDNPKAVSELLHREHPELKQVWVKSSKSKEQFPEYIETVEFDSKDYYKYACRAQVVVDNHTGLRATTFLKNGKLRAFLKKTYAKKRRGQFCVSTWHGTPLKRIALDEPNRANEDFCSNSDYIVAGCSLTETALKSGFRNVIPVKMYGTPRNDILFSNCDISELKKKLGIPQNKKCILFAPTFRNSVEYSGVNQMSDFDFHTLLLTLREKFGSEWCFVFRVHNMVLQKIDVKSIVDEYGKSVIINGNLHDDMAEYLLCADALITDYSGAMFDYALTGRPCFLYVPDRENYEKKERGFYIDFDGLPFPKSGSPAEFLDQIRAFDMDAYQKQLSSFLKQIGNVEDGHASERIVNDITKFLNENSSL